jgi:hypothetical protein
VNGGVRAKKKFSALKKIVWAHCVALRVRAAGGKRTDHSKRVCFQRFSSNGQPVF